MSEIKKKCIFAFLLVSSLSGTWNFAYPFGSHSSGPDKPFIPTSFSTLQEKLLYLETLYREDEDHYLAYELAHLYLQVGARSKAEEVLRDDLDRRLNPFDAYESYSLLVGLYIDRRSEIPEDMIRRFDDLFLKMKKKAPSTLAKLDSEERFYHESREGLVGKDHRTYEELLMLRRRVEGYTRDLLQYERMIGDYYYMHNDYERALHYYDHFYQDLDKPPGTFNPRSMRNYVTSLLKQNRLGDAIYFLGLLVNLKPYMFSDLFWLATLYYQLGDCTSALIVMMFTNTLADGYSKTFYEESHAMILRLIEEMEEEPFSGNSEGKAVSLARAYLSGSNLSSFHILIDGMRSEGVHNFFFQYLEGVSYFIKGDYRFALDRFREFQAFYPYLAETHYYEMQCMYMIDPKVYGEDILERAEQTIKLKPDSLIARFSKQQLGVMLGLGKKDGEKLLVPYEIEKVLNDFITLGSEVKELEKLLPPLTIPENSYQIAQVQLMSRVSHRREEYISFLKDRYSSLNGHGKKKIAEVLYALGETIH
ncbi:MAG: tetratricopeptide repeat protein [Spirochaetota bacterium]